MTLDSLGNVGELIGGLAVIASLIYLAIQIRQNTDSVRLQVEQAIKRDQIDLRRSIIENPEVADLFARSLEDFDSLSPADRIRAHMAAANTIEHLQQVFLMRDRGLVPWESQETVLRGYMALEACRRWWSLGRDILHPEFVEYVEREILPASTSDTPLHWKP
jgi:hypothetical protein